MPTLEDLAAIVLLTASLCCACRSTAPSAESAESASRAPSDAKEMWAEYVRLAAPSEHHRALEPLIGRFEVSAKSWMEPGSPPEEMRGTMENRWILGGRFVQGELEGRMDGMPFEGIQTLGFDNAKQRYVATWIDNTGTDIMPVMQGTADTSGKVITITGTLDDPILHKSLDVREVWTIKSDREHELAMWSREKDGQEFKMLEIVFTRM